jgi:hypothetical protein
VPFLKYIEIWIGQQLVFSAFRKHFGVEKRDILISPIREGCITMSTETLKARVVEEKDKIRDRLIEMSETIHSYAETGYKDMRPQNSS